MKFFRKKKLNFHRSTEEKCTKAQSCSAGNCTWNQHMIFFDIQTLDNILLWIKLIDLDYNQEILGDIKLHSLNLNNKPEWYNLNGRLKTQKNFSSVFIHL